MKLNRLQIIVLSAMGGIAVLGGVGLWLLSAQVDAVQDQIAQQNGVLQQLTGGHFYPSQRNLDALQKNNAALTAVLAEIQKRLQSGSEKLGFAVEKNAVVFKQEMADQLKNLRDEAAKNTVRIDPAAANFGFTMYQNVNPSDRATPILGRQLMGIEAVSDALFRARISSLDMVRRTPDENGPEEGDDAASKSPGKGVGGGEALPLRIATLPGGLYTIYPLEFEFTGSEEAVRAGLANLAASPFFLVPRVLVITSRRTAAPRLDDLARSVQAAEKKPTFLIALGNEEIHVRARIDLVDWSGGSNVAPKP